MHDGPFSGRDAGQGMRILFYLPVVTPWWFSERITPILRALHGDAELHIMVAPIWSSTGIGPDQLAPLSDLPGINWHVVEADDPALFRTNGAAVEGLVQRIHQIAPDITLARSADFETPATFPGTVRYLMEGATPPFRTEVLPLQLEERPFRLGFMPKAEAPLAARCMEAFADIWDMAAPIRRPLAQHDWRAALGLPADRPILTVPLQYEHEEDFFRRKSAYARGIDLLQHLLEATDPALFLAVTDHPLNRKYVDRSDIDALLAAHGDRAMLCRNDVFRLGPTGILAAHGDAMLIEQSKSWMLAAFCGSPMISIGHSDTAPWLNATQAAGGALQHWPQGGLEKPDSEEARRWMCWRMGARIFDPPSLDIDRLMAHVSGNVGDDIIEANAMRLRERERQAA